MSQQNMNFDNLMQAATVGGTVYVAGLGAKLLIPAAMAAFGTIVPGVGTIHVAGGIASLLQSAAAHAVSNSVVAATVSVPVLYIRSKL